jgi:restriction system protein
MPASGDDPRFTKLASDAAEAVRRLKTLESRLTRIEQAVQPDKIRPDKLAKELTDLRQQVKLLEIAQQKTASALQENAARQADQEARWREAAEKTASEQRTINVIDEVLSSGLPPQPPTFDELEDRTEFPPFDPGSLGVAEPPFTPEPEPQRPRFALLGGTARHEQDKEQWRKRNEAAEEERRQRETERLRKLLEKQKQHGQAKAEHQATKNARNTMVTEMKAAFASGAPEAVRWLVLETLKRSRYPAWYPPADRHYQLVCRPDHHDVFVELELPTLGIIPTAQSYHGLAGRTDLLVVPRPQDEVRQQYARLIAGISLRTIAEILTATENRAALVQAVTLNGRSRGIDPATGQEICPHLLSMRITRGDLNTLDLTHAEPLSCLAHLGARISAEPANLQAVEPLESFPAAATD